MPGCGIAVSNMVDVILQVSVCICWPTNDNTIIGSYQYSSYRENRVEC